jgi:hypothetical protein
MIFAHKGKENGRTMSANEMATTSVKKVDSDLERAADAWTRYAERLTFDAWDAWHQSARILGTRGVRTGARGGPA